MNLDETTAPSAGADRSDDAVAARLPVSLALERHEDTAVLRLSRPRKRNALDDATVLGLEAFFTAPPAWARCVVLDAEGEHFSAGLDLGELVERDAVESLEHSRTWHRAFSAIERGRLPVVSVLRGAVIGGGLELACATHVRVAEPSAFYALPEGQRGLFVGGGGSVRLPRLIGTARVADLMLTGRVLDAEEGLAVGISQYLVGEGAGLAEALVLAAKIASNAPVSNYAVVQALPRIAEADPDQGFFLEALMSSTASGTAEAKDRLRSFLEGRSAKVTPLERRRDR